MIEINHRDSRPIYEQIKDGIRRLAMTGVAPPDSKIPSVRELAGELSINPNTISRAYKELEMEGVIYSVPGRGSFVAPIEKAREKHVSDLYDNLKTTVKDLIEVGESPDKIMERMKEVLG
ncbi:MAG: GntR family transcriptional regulator [Lachnospiraceae bacterium]|nr:GntR family transcriptional regulator [Lachnospiraceae bacterium]